MPLPTPKPPTADGNPPEYSAMKDLAERCAKAEAELERVKIERDALLGRCEDALNQRDNAIREMDACHKCWDDFTSKVCKVLPEMKRAALFTMANTVVDVVKERDALLLAANHMEACRKTLNVPDGETLASAIDRVKIERDEAYVARDFADAALERVQKREAAMREVLGFALECANELLEYNGENFQFNMRGKMWSLKTRSGAALQPDAGSDTL